MNSYSHIADGTAKLSGRDHEFRPTAQNFKANRAQPAESTDDAEARADF